MAQDSAAARNVVTLHRAPAPPFVQARVDIHERLRTDSVWGDLKASTLSGVMREAETGNVSRWADLCKWAISTTGHLTSLYTTAIDRVVQADWVIAPPKYGDSAMGKLAAEFINEQVSRIEGWQQAERNILSALGCGFSVNEMEWARDQARKLWYVKRIHHREAHRFRFDEAWQLRLYDNGRPGGRTLPVGQRYGEQLDPRTSIVHIHQEVAGYPGGYGIMRSCIWDWMFARWVSKFSILFLEKFGSPLAVVKLDPDTKQTVREQALADLQTLNNEHVGVIEGHEIELIETGQKSAEDFDKYDRSANERMTKAWLGASDAVDPGQNGARAAVETRVGATMDPRMVTRGVALAETLRHSLFKQLIAHNLHHLGAASIDQVPIPEMRFKTADDEVKVDQGDKAQEIGRDMEAPAQQRQVPAVASVAHAPHYAPQPTALSRDQMLSIRETIADVQAGLLSRSSAVAMLTVGFLLSESAAERILGEPLIVASQQEPVIPKAPAPVAPGQTTKPGTSAKTATIARQQTSLRYPSPFAKRRTSA